MDLHKTDNEFITRFESFAFDEVINEENQQLDDDTRYMAILATLIGCGGIDAFEEMLDKAMKDGFDAVKVKEIIYQATDYLGYGKMLPFLKCANKYFEQNNIQIDDNRATTTPESRLEKGVEAQAEIFGEHMKEAYKKSHINRYLASNCFGDYYTRRGLDLRQRELITFCFLSAQGGCEPQLTAHAKGNMNMGNDKDFLIKVVTQCLPYIGYPRSLNAMNCINKASEM